MSLFPASEFGPLFRLLDDYDTHRSANSTRSVRAFQPKFDVREEKDAWKLDGELPGVEQKDVQIEFVDPHTLVIKGRTEREWSSGTPPNAAEGEHHNNSYHKATVEDVTDEGTSGKKSPGTEVAKTDSGKKQVSKEHTHKYWVTERSVGEFHRSFSFPTRVDQDAVKANLKNGILSVTVPKALAPQARRIQIE
ncbi:MAG: hypothetical protein MMC33_003590 [Icmadophila ericetorum]|nr:hypothetical protein [Icmadophila ericetorum]